MQTGNPPSKKLLILHEEDDFVVIAKPPRLAAHRSAMVRDRRTVLSLTRNQLGTHVWLPHRLDRATSGCMLVAKSPEASAALHDALRDPRATKRYVALVRGPWRHPEEVAVDKPMKNTEGVLQEAHTKVRLLGNTKDPRSALVLAQPMTGRYHQVRRHLRDLSHPILRDSSHGDSRVNTEWRDARGLRRLALHCAELELPWNDGVLHIRCPLPTDLHRVISKLPFWERAKTRYDLLEEEPVHLWSPAQ